MRTRIVAGLLALFLLAAFRARAATEANSTYTELRALKQHGEAVSIQNLVIDRDVFRFRFDSGSFQFLTLSDGRVVEMPSTACSRWIDLYQI